jgi:hypothetical protein
MGLRTKFPLAKIESKEEGELDATIYIATKWMETAKRQINCRNTAISRQGLRKSRLPQRKRLPHPQNASRAYGRK